jgi:ParB/RepB/Spo0J family partition protein
MNETVEFTEADVVQMRIRVHNAFKAKGLSIREAERDCGVAVGTFQKFIAGENAIIGAGNLARIAALTGVSADALLFGERPSSMTDGGPVPGGPVTGGAVREIAHSAIQPSALNPRKRGFDPASLRSLAESIAAHGGLMQNLVVRPMDPDATETGPFELIAGERRWRAYALLIAEGRVPETVRLPCAVRVLTDDDAMELMLVENMERQDLSPMEEGRAFLELWTRRRQAFGRRKAGDVVKHLAERLNRSERFIQKRIRLARDLVPEAQAALEEGKILLAHAEVLATAPKDAQAAQTAFLLAHGTPETQPSARTIGQSIAGNLPDSALAVFKRKDYDGEVFEFDGHDYAVDIPLFARLQDKAIEARRAEYTRKLKTGALAFVDEGPAFKASSYVSVAAEDIDPDEPPILGVYIEIQDKGAWRVARFIEYLDRPAAATPPAPARAAKTQGEDDGDDDFFANDDEGDAPPPAKSAAAARLTPAAEKAAAEQQFGPLRAALSNRIELCLALALFDVLSFSCLNHPNGRHIRIGTTGALPTPGDELLERCLKTLDMRWDKNGATEADEELFAKTLLEKLLNAPLSQLERLVAHILAEDAIPNRPLELNALERRVFQAAGLDPDAASAAAKEAA